ncbi:hypothetical protein NHX12_002330 [Muraenolepis orangiensis]|uniref:Uncharacterized protein n=1 Tax=Muraenolepis orangiensis TaxID=630683 RepID=A0A9Q0IFC1_9TELE|nr:hypothetical protein NHX12_002330 [Muraenolepis orangiensis]
MAENKVGLVTTITTLNAEVVLTFDPPPPDNPFRIDGTQLLAETPLDYEDTEEVSPEGVPSPSTTIMVSIKDDDNRPPWFKPCSVLTSGMIKICPSNGYTGEVSLTVNEVGLHYPNRDDYRGLPTTTVAPSTTSDTAGPTWTRSYFKSHWDIPWNCSYIQSHWDIPWNCSYIQSHWDIPWNCSYFQSHWYIPRNCSYFQSYWDIPWNCSYFESHWDTPWNCFYL